MGRLGRKVVEGMRRYDELPADWRERFERALSAAKDALVIVEDLKRLAPGLGELWMDVAIMAFTEGKIAGNWTKVHAELASGAPRLYAVIGPLLPRDEASPL